MAANRLPSGSGRAAAAAGSEAPRRGQDAGEDLLLAADAVIRTGLELIDQVERGFTPPQEVRYRLSVALEEAEARVGLTADWALARYALVVWLDERLVDADWAGSDWWRNNVLEAECYGTRMSSSRFFELADEAGALPRKDALTVFRSCFVLGFRGRYRELEGESQGTAEAGEAWLRRINLRLDRSDDDPPPTVWTAPRGSPPLRARSRLLYAALAALAVLSFDAILIRYLLPVSG